MTSSNVPSGTCRLAPDKLDSEPSLRALTLQIAAVVATIAIGTAWAIAVSPWREHRAVARLEQKGARVVREYCGPRWISRLIPYRWTLPMSLITRVDVFCEDPSKANLDLLADLPDLDTIILEGPGFNDEAVSPLKRLKGIDWLVLHDTEVTDACLQHLASIDRLRFLGLSGAEVSGAGLGVLKDLPALQSLNLLRTRIRDDRLSDLASFSRLEYLQLKETEISDAGLKHLSMLTNLRWLGLAETNVTDDGLQTIAALVNLRFIDLSETAIGDAGLLHLRALPSIESVDLTGSGITQDGVDRLKSVHPKLHLIWK